MVETARRLERKLMVYQPHRLSSECLGAKAILESGKLGSPYMFSRYSSNFCRRNDWQAFYANGGGMLFNYGAHYIDQIYIAPLTHINEAQGNVCLSSELSLRNGNSPFENMAMISRDFYNGVFGHGTGSMKQINHPGGHDGFWLEYLQQKKQTRFPVELLKSAGKKLEDIL